jgi:hypothetical protein
MRKLHVHIFYVFSILLAGFVGNESAVAATYEPGHQALQLWNETAMNNAPQWLNIWLSVLVGSFALGLLFVWRHVAARWLVGGFILMVLFVLFIAPILELMPFSGLFALLHIIFWMPGFLILLKERPFLNGFSFYGLWGGLITVVILISFVFDLPNAAIYLDHILGMGLLA